jgi:hypothetical protein
LRNLVDSADRAGDALDCFDRCARLALHVGDLLADIFGGLGGSGSTGF